MNWSCVVFIGLWGGDGDCDLFRAIDGTNAREVCLSVFGLWIGTVGTVAGSGRGF